MGVTPIWLSFESVPPSFFSGHAHRARIVGAEETGVAVHMPRGEAELDEAKVRAVADELHVFETLVLDNDHAVTDTFDVKAVPTYFLFTATTNCAAAPWVNSESNLSAKR